jgi:hypothetical protein
MLHNMYLSLEISPYAVLQNEPFKRWQFVQWQYALRMGGAESVNDTLPQKQLPFSMNLGSGPGPFGASGMILIWVRLASIGKGFIGSMTLS